MEQGWVKETCQLLTSGSFKTVETLCLNIKSNWCIFITLGQAEDDFIAFSVHLLEGNHKQKYGLTAGTIAEHQTNCPSSSKLFCSAIFALKLSSQQQTLLRSLCLVSLL